MPSAIAAPINQERDGPTVRISMPPIPQPVIRTYYRLCSLQGAFSSQVAPHLQYERSKIGPVGDAMVRRLLTACLLIAAFGNATPSLAEVHPQAADTDAYRRYYD